MNIWDRALGCIGLVRRSRMFIQSYVIRDRGESPTFVDLRLIDGRHVQGYVCKYRRRLSRWRWGHGAGLLMPMRPVRSRAARRLQESHV